MSSEICIRGETRDALDLSDLITPHYRTFLFYPSDDAVELDKQRVAQIYGDGEFFGIAIFGAHK